MGDEHGAGAPRERAPAPAIGGDLVIPLLSVAFTLYYFFTIWDLTWEAQINGFLVGSILILLVAALLARSAGAVLRGKAHLGLGPLGGSRGLQMNRLGLLGLSVAFMILIQWLGFTLATFGFLLASLYLLGVRSPKTLAGLPLLLSAGGYLLFILALDTRFPRGPVEWALGAIFGRLS